MPLDRRHLRKLVEGRKAHFVSTERDLFDKIERFYNGEFFGNVSTHNRTLLDGVEADPRTSVNLIFAHVDTAKAMMLGQTMAIAANGVTPEAAKIQHNIGRLVSAVFRDNDMREVTSVCIDNAFTKRRGTFKTIWDASKNRPCVYSVEPSHVGYDLSAKVQKDSRFWMDCVHMPWRTFKGRVADGTYKRPGKLSQPVKPDTYPEWAKIGDKAKSFADDVFGIAIVWEVYDLIEGKAYHYHETTGDIVWEGAADDHPLSMFSFNHNLRNLDGKCESELIVPQQESINNIMTTINQVTHRIVPRMLYDSGLIDEDELGAAYDSAAGTINPIKMLSNNGRSLKEGFFELPTASLDPQLFSAMELHMGHAQYVTGVSGAARGIRENVRTAAEMGNREAFERSRVAYREGNLRSAISRVGERVIRLMQKYGQGPYTIKDKNTFTQLNQIDLNQFHGHFDIAPYSPVKSNPRLLAEILGQVSNIVMNEPTANREKFLNLLMESMGVTDELFDQQPPPQPPNPEQMVASHDAQVTVDPAGGSMNMDAAAQGANE